MSHCSKYPLFSTLPQHKINSACSGMSELLCSEQSVSQTIGQQKENDQDNTKPATW